MLRNPHALATMFMMPAIFVLVMSFTLKNTLTVSVPFPRTGWVIEDSGTAAAQWVRDWTASHNGPVLATRQALKAALRARQVDAGVVVRAPWTDAAGLPRAEQLEVWLGNQLEPAAAARLRTELSFAILQTRIIIAAEQAGPFALIFLDSSRDVTGLLKPGQAPVVRYLYEIDSGRSMTAVQQSVPAWLVFGMFFVVIPIAAVLIQERNNGTLARLQTFGVRPDAILVGKLLAYMLLNWLQLALMLVVGRIIVPLFGGDALQLNVSPGWFVLMVLVTSVAAVGFALLLSSRARSFEHAAALGGGFNVILGAIAGVMVPRMLMPAQLQTISEWSPMGWALDGLQCVFLGSPDIAFIGPRAGLLLMFGLVCLAFAWAPLRRIEYN